MKRKLFAEFLGTFGIVFAPVMASAAKTDLAIAAWVSGLAVMAMIYVFGSVSGAHFNPAVTLALTLDGKHEKREVIPYMSAQLLGGVAAAGLVFVMFGQGAGMHIPAAPHAVLRNVATEVVLSFILMMVIFAVVREAVKFAPLVIGLTVVLLVMMGGNVTGGSMNPARSFGPGLFGGAEAMGSLWIYLVAPVLGMFLAWVTDSRLHPARS